MKREEIENTEKWGTDIEDMGEASASEWPESSSREDRKSGKFFDTDQSHQLLWTPRKINQKIKYKKK